MATKKADALTPETLEVGPPSWSPDGKSIAFMGKEGKDAERYNTWNLYVMEARAGAAPRDDHEIRRAARSSAGRGRPEWSPDGSRLRLPAELRRETERVQHEPARGGSGGRRRAEDFWRTSWIAAFRRRALRRTANRFCSWWPTIAGSIRRAVPANGGEVQRCFKGRCVINGARSGQGRQTGGSGGERQHVRRDSRAREQRTARVDAPQRRADGGVEARRDGRVQLQGEGRQ